MLAVILVIVIFRVVQKFSSPPFFHNTQPASAVFFKLQFLTRWAATETFRWAATETFRCTAIETFRLLGWLRAVSTPLLAMVTFAETWLLWTWGLERQWRALRLSTTLAPGPSTLPFRRSGRSQASASWPPSQISSCPAVIVAPSSLPSTPLWPLCATAWCPSALPDLICRFGHHSFSWMKAYPLIFYEFSSYDFSQLYPTESPITDVIEAFFRNSLRSLSTVSH